MKLEILDQISEIGYQCKFDDLPKHGFSKDYVLFVYDNKISRPFVNDLEIIYEKLT